ncbi:MAG: tRNA (adenosine(37)-N6)-threonylcarbamoyltransferase complex dimerization subunit type 1 TsaB [Candidatus Helarchaeota archaeon]|nr:tRNA (adenosine(37)-N6)-threonylcarbamoyltransferase complex dimerization subunit type 1 TsaB [Candidatus Helarchaeota archaeon]
MIILGIETSSSVCGIGITIKEKLLAELRINISNAHSEKLFQGINILTNEASLKLEEISGVAVSSGPGSFTGLRIGLSAAKGIAYALHIPLFLIPTLDVFANYGLGFGKDICSIIPSIREDIFYSYYREIDRKVKRFSEYKLGKIDEVELDSNKGMFFTGIIDKKLRNKIEKKFSDSEIYFANEFDLSSGYLVAKMGYIKMIEGEPDDIEDSEPLYLRDFDIKMKKL